MFKRTISKKITEAVKKYPVISITGPRQSGKTILSKSAFKSFAYFNLENPATREFARNDPKAFLDQNNKMVIDEVQRVPKLFSYIQTIVDDDKKRRFVITGSENFLISKKISQTLSGRVAIFKLLPLSLKEMQKNKISSKNIYEALFQGCYPRIYDLDLKAEDWYPNYIQTYIERDVRNLKSIKDLSSFQTFLGLCAGRTGQILNLSSLANDTGISVPTVKEWLSVLEASYIIHRLQPYFRNFNKRLIKSPKIYFYDTGLACSLLKINKQEQLQKHPLIGNIFETFVVGEIKKQAIHNQKNLDFYYFRDQQGNEVDLLFEKEGKIHLTEIKSAQTYKSNFSKIFDYFKKISGEKTVNKIFFAGSKMQKRSNFTLLPWDKISKILS